MFKLRIALVLFALTAACISPAVAQTAQGTNVGRLSCAMSPSIGLIVGSGSGCHVVSLLVVVLIPPKPM